MDGPKPVPDAIRAIARLRLASPPQAIAASHLILIRSLEMTWIAAEHMAPAVHGMRPLGADDTLAQAAAALGTTDPAIAAVHLVDLAVAFPKFIAAGELAPGTYAVPEAFRARIAPAEATIDAESRILITAEHVKLLKAFQPHSIDASVLDDALAEGLWPIWSVDPKRPFGERRIYEEDMAVILGTARPGPGGVVAVTEEQRRRMQALYAQTRVAAQVFCLFADLPSVPFRI